MSNLTADEIREVEAGREMDALVAERVMGYTMVDRINDFPDHGSLVKMPHDGPLEIYMLRTAPVPYSTEIAAAWEVVEHLARRGWRLSLFDCRNIPKEQGPAWWWEWHYEDQARHVNEIDGLAPTAPLAICRAALLATLETDPDPT